MRIQGGTQKHVQTLRVIRQKIGVVKQLLLAVHLGLGGWPQASGEPQREDDLPWKVQRFPSGRAKTKSSKAFWAQFLSKISDWFWHPPTGSEFSELPAPPHFRMEGLGSEACKNGNSALPQCMLPNCRLDSLNRRKFRSQTSDNMTKEKQRWEKSERIREEKKNQRREIIRREKRQAREKGEKSHNTVFFSCFGAPEGWKVGLLKRQVRSHLVRWAMKNCTPWWLEADLEVKMPKTAVLEHS